MEYIVHQNKKTSTLLSPHQLILQNYISINTLNDNLLVFHALGTGKTLSAIAIAEGFKEYIYNLNRKIIVIVKNKTIVNNFSKEIYKLHRDKSIHEVKALIQKYYTFKTFGKLTNQLTKNKIDFSNSVIIIDEAHNLTSNEGYKTIRSILDNSYNTRLVMLTATPVKNDISEFFELANLLNHKIPGNAINTNLLSIVTSSTKLAGTKLYQITEKGEQLLEKELAGKISYLAPDLATFPREYLQSNESTKQFWNSNMSDYQYKIYKKQLDNKTDTLYKTAVSSSFIVYPNQKIGSEGYDTIIQKDKLLPEYKHVLNFDQDLEKYSCKLHTLIKILKESTGKVFIYTNIVTKGGTSLLKHLLIENGFKEWNSGSKTNSFIVFDSNVSDTQRKLYLDAFNNKQNFDGSKVRIIIGSQVLSEGITLKAIRQVHILDASWNMTQINQIIGRAVRKFSHSDLPIRERNVKVYKHIATYTDNPNSTFIDKEKYILSTEKDKINTKLYRTLKRIAFDCHLHHERNQLEPRFDYTSKCDYQVCNYTCKSKPFDKTKKNNFIYNINFVLQDDIKLLNILIPKMFKMSPIWLDESLYDYINNESKGTITPESIDFVISTIIDKKITVYDMHERPGHIVGYGKYYIFNPKDKDIFSSFFTKTLDYSEIYHDNTIDKFAASKGITKTKETTKDPIAETTQSPEIIKINDKIKQKFKLYGTYYVKGTNRKDKFKIVDIRTFVDTQDPRKEITGKVCTSFKRQELEDIAKELGLEHKANSISGLCKAIEQEMTKQKRVLQ